MFLPLEFQCNGSKRNTTSIYGHIYTTHDIEGSLQLLPRILLSNGNKFSSISSIKYKHTARIMSLGKTRIIKQGTKEGEVQRQAVSLMMWILENKKNRISQPYYRP